MTTPLDYFHMEAIERLERLSSGLMALERSGDDQTLIDSLFREAHSLKGAAGVSGLTDVSEICHKMEDLLSRVREGTEHVSAEMTDALLAATDAVQEIVAARMHKQDSDVVPARVIERLGNLETPGEPTSRGACGKAIPGASTAEEVAGKTAPLPEPVQGFEPTSELRDARDGDSAPIAAPQHKRLRAAEGARATERAEDPLPSAPETAPTMETVRLRVDMLESLANLTGELMVVGDRLRQRLSSVKDLHHLLRSECNRHHHVQGIERILRPAATGARKLIDDFTSDFTVLEPLIAEVHERVLDTRMLPISVLFDRLQRFVRDYCRQEGKQAELHIDGADTLVDRQVLEQLRDPMIHMVRNALSHGIESSDERQRLGKEPIGAVRLTTFRRGDRIRITCEDDGRGIDRQLVLDRAVSAGMVTPVESEVLSAMQILELILRPGFSTADTTTDVSGRGVGMDVVARRVEALRGTLGIKSEPGKFTRFVLEFPSSVATLEGLLVEAAGFTYVVPTATVERTAGIRLPEVQTAGGEAFANIDGQVVPLVMLANVLGRSQCAKVAPNLMPAVVVRSRDHRIALGVERLLGTQTVVAKSLGDHIRSVRGVVGATILGTGLPALILDPGRLLRDGRTGSSRREVLGREAGAEAKSEPILIVDDSITTRMMEQTILKSAGYSVSTAVSAEDALAKVQDATYRLFLVDVEMPGLNGFELTRKLRQDQRFAETPIIIVTSLAKEEHRREGLEAGANAYIVKGEFDQDNLLETVERLVGR